MNLTSLSPSISKVFAIIFLRSADGTRLYSKYCFKVVEGQLEKVEVQKEFEKNIWEKGKRVGSRLARGSETEIFQYCQFNILMKAFNEVNLYVIGDFEENEILLSQVSTTIYESLQHITKDHISKKNLLEQFDQLILIIDEIIDEG